MAHYELRKVPNGAVLSTHRTRRAALDAWPKHVGIPVRIVRTLSTGKERVIVAGTWMDYDNPPED